MSGDAQPRKRKDKRKKKEDAAEEEIFISLKHATDEVIHVQKETGCGGNTCTKVIFFCLLATLGLMIGLILLEYRGSTDEETSSSVDSPWSLMFEDWIDKAPDIGHGEHSDEHDDLPEEDHDEGSHEEEHDEHEEEELDEDKGDEENHEADEPGEEGQDDGGGGILSWMGLGGGKEEEAETDQVGLLGWFGFGASDQGEEEEEVKTSSSGWFGFGGTNDEEPQNEERDVENEKQDEDDKDMVDDFENEEEEEEEEEEDEVDEEDDDDGLGNQEIEEDEEEEEEEEIEDKHSLKEDEEEDDESEEKDDSTEDQSQEDMKEDDDEIVKDRNIDKEYEDEGIEQDEDELEDKDDGEEENEPIERLVTVKYKNKPKDQGSKDDEDEGIEEDDVDEQDNEEDDNLSKEDDNLSKEDDNLSKEDDNLSKEDDNLSKEDDGDEQIEEKIVGEAEEETESLSDHSFLETKNVEDDEKTNEGGKANVIADEELFPEALAALKRESEELAAKESHEKIEDDGVKGEEEVTDSEGSGPGEEDDGTDGTGQEEIEVTTESRNLAGRDFDSGDSSGEKFWSPASEAPPPLLQPTPAPRVEELPTLVAKEEPLEQSEGEEEMGEEEEDEEPEIDKKEFHSLLAKYGRDSPESSDLEPSDEEVQQVEYSEGEESVGEEEESPNEEEEAVSEDDLKDWTGIQKTEVETPEESESEVEEEPSEDEAPPPPPPQPQTRSRGGPRAHLEDYPYAHLTNDEDWTIREDLDQADEEFNYDKARPLYENILKKYPNSPRARYGYARTFDKEAELLKSNKVLNQALAGYYHSLSSPNITDDLFITVAQRLINRLRFRGLYMKAVEIHRQLIERFPSTPEYKSDLGINYLMVNRLEDAGSVFEEVLCKWPEDPVALAHLGLVFKLQGRILKAIKYLQRGLADDMPFTRDARLYFHLGDALTRVGRTEEAMKLYEKAVSNGLFRSVYQRSLYNVDRLTARPWWTLQQTTYHDFLRSLEANWEGIRDEGMKALKINGSYRDEAEGLRDKGDWKQFELFARGVKMKNNCEMTPLTCSILSSFEPVSSCRRGQSKFSVMEGGTHVWPHCGPTNCRLRAHLGLIVPQGLSLRVAHQTRSWIEGKVLVFDDSFEHEVWHNGTSLRLVLIVDLWHPELTPQERLSLSTI